MLPSKVRATGLCPQSLHDNVAVTKDVGLTVVLQSLCSLLSVERVDDRRLMTTPVISSTIPVTSRVYLSLELNGASNVAERPAKTATCEGLFLSLL